jgi:DNA-binding NtrC family response regulator
MQTVRRPAVSLLILDDNPGSLELLSSALAQADLEILTASDPEEGLDLVYDRHPQIVLTDLVMPRLSGLEVLERVMEFDSSIDVILMTAHYSTESAVEAIKKGACDYLNKPVSIAALRERVGKLIESARKRQHALQLEDELLSNSEFEGIIGNSPLMWDLFSRIRRVAPHYRSVLVTGETGTGKDLVALALHRLSPAAVGRYVVLNCSAVVETLFESELFGHVKGSFTGAAHDKPGLVEHAHGGTLFLDEIGDMPLATQAKLLRVLQNQEVQRVGSLTPRKVDLRVIAVTNRDLRSAIAAKTFREDLYYRLSMVEIHIPRLAQRREDLPLLERHFVARFAEQYGKKIRGLTPRADPPFGAHLARKRKRVGKRDRSRVHADAVRPYRRSGPSAVFAVRKRGWRCSARAGTGYGSRHAGRAGAAPDSARSGAGRRQSIQGRTAVAHRPRCAPLQAQETQSRSDALTLWRGALVHAASRFAATLSCD